MSAPNNPVTRNPISTRQIVVYDELGNQHTLEINTYLIEVMLLDTGQRVKRVGPDEFEIVGVGQKLFIARAG